MEEKKNSLIPPEEGRRSAVGGQQSAVGAVGSNLSRRRRRKRQRWNFSRRSAVGGRGAVAQPVATTKEEATAFESTSVSSTATDPVAVRASALAGSPRTISIKPENHRPKGPQTEDGENPIALPEKEFDQEKLEKVWAYYTESIAGQYPNFYSILSTRKPVLKEDYLIELQLDNRAQEITLRDRRGDLLDFLRGELQNQKIQMEHILVETETQSKPYKPEEKYKAMAEKNPGLQAFKEKLDLEIEL